MLHGAATYQIYQLIAGPLSVCSDDDSCPSVRLDVITKTSSSWQSNTIATYGTTAEQLVSRHLSLAGHHHITSATYQRHIEQRYINIFNAVTSRHVTWWRHVTRVWVTVHAPPSRLAHHALPLTINPSSARQLCLARLSCVLLVRSTTCRDVDPAVRRLRRDDFSLDAVTLPYGGNARDALHTTNRQALKQWHHSP